MPKAGYAAEDFIEIAGAAWARVFMETVWPKLSISISKICILAGPGNNGKDAQVVFRELRKAVAVNKSLSSLTVQILQIDPYDFKNDSSVNFSTDSKTLSDSGKKILFIDGIFGTGYRPNRSSRDLSIRFIAWMKSLGKISHVSVALDIPSGMDCDTGASEIWTLKAFCTITLGYHKLCSLTALGRANLGRVLLCPLPYPAEHVKSTLTLHEAHPVRKFWPKIQALLKSPRDRSHHKKSLGEIFVFAGSEEYPGAGFLTTRAAQRLGCGYVHWVSTSSLLERVPKSPSLLHHECTKTNLPKIQSTVLKLMQKHNFVCALGPGWTDKRILRSVLESLIAGTAVNPLGSTAVNTSKKQVWETKGFCILDAGALDALMELKTKVPDHWILTPHSGEMARMMGWTPEWVEENRFEAVRRTQEKWGGIVLLKGAFNLVQYRGKTHAFVGPTAALAKAGSGDVFTGMTAALLARTSNPFFSLLMAVAVQDQICRWWKKKGGNDFSLLPEDQLEFLESLSGNSGPS